MERDVDGTARAHTFSIELSFDSLLHVSQVVCVQPGWRIATKITETRGL